MGRAIIRSSELILTDHTILLTCALQVPFPMPNLTLVCHFISTDVATLSLFGSNSCHNVREKQKTSCLLVFYFEYSKMVDQ